jgi:putative PIN family toxin of toxin-antitoxin system
MPFNHGERQSKLVVVDTNILVSAFWSPNGDCAKIIALLQNRNITACYDQRILTEYHEVLARPKFGFDQWEIIDFLSFLEHDGVSVVPPPLSMEFTDEDDRAFYETAKHGNARLITGNIKHFPKDGVAVLPKEFLRVIIGV